MSGRCRRLTPTPTATVPTAALWTDGDTLDNGDFDDQHSPASSPSPHRPTTRRRPTSDTNNTYNAVVRASDGGVTTWVEYFKVTVTVLNVEEKGKVAWTVDPDGTGGIEAPVPPLLEFQAGAILTAAVTDPDSVASGNDNGGITDRHYVAVVQVVEHVSEANGDNRHE